MRPMARRSRPQWRRRLRSCAPPRLSLRRLRPASSRRRASSQTPGSAQGTRASRRRASAQGLGWFDQVHVCRQGGALLSLCPCPVPCTGAALSLRRRSLTRRTRTGMGDWRGEPAGQSGARPGSGYGGVPAGHSYAPPASTAARPGSYAPPASTAARPGSGYGGGPPGAGSYGSRPHSAYGGVYPGDGTQRELPPGSRLGGWGKAQVCVCMYNSLCVECVCVFVYNIHTCMHTCIHNIHT
jgi:hypothetical protein